MRTLQDQLIEKGVVKSCNNPNKNISKRKVTDESLSNRDWEELMGVRRDTFKRVGGAIKRR